MPIKQDNPTQINQGGARNQENQPPEQTGSFKLLKQPAGPYDGDKTDPKTAKPKE